MEYIRETLADGEELVLFDANEESPYDGPDPRLTSLRLRRDAVAQQSSTSRPSGH